MYIYIGPVATAIIKEAFSAKSGAVHKFSTVNSDDVDKMSPARHAQLMARAIASKQDECWISPHPYLFFTYLAQYLPVPFNLINRIFASMRVKAYKSGVETMSMSGLWQHYRGNKSNTTATKTD